MINYKKTFAEAAIFCLAFLAFYYVRDVIFNDDAKQAEFESYVFIDEVGVLHTSSKCNGIHDFDVLNKVEINSLQPYEIEKYCTRCVSEEQYQALKSLFKTE